MSRRAQRGAASNKRNTRRELSLLRNHLPWSAKSPATGLGGVAGAPAWVRLTSTERAAGTELAPPALARKAAFHALPNRPQGAARAPPPGLPDILGAEAARETCELLIPGAT